MTPTTYSNIHVWANMTVYFIVLVGVGYYLWQVLATWYAWLIAIVVMAVVVGYIGHRLFPRLTGPIVDYLIKDKVNASK